MLDKQKELFETRKLDKEKANKKLMENSRERLKTLSTKKFKTSFVFAIAEFEKVFGLDLWGHGLPDDQTSDLQKANKERWSQVRTNILNKGNTQARAMCAELDLHDIKFVGYKMDLAGGNRNG